MTNAAPHGRGNAPGSYKVRDPENGKFKKIALPSCVREDCTRPAYTRPIFGETEPSGLCLIHGLEAQKASR